MCARRGSIGFMVFCMLLVVLCWQTPTRAASVPPTIAQIVGTYSVTDMEVYYYFDVGFPVKEKYNVTWRIYPLSDTTVQVYIEDWDWPFTAYYKNGFLVQSSGDVSDPTGSWAALGIASFSGKPGKVKFKGDFGWGQFGSGWSDEYVEWDPYRGKMISTDPDFQGSGAVASQDDEQVGSAQEERAVPLAIVSPLTIDDLQGTYSCTLTGTMYHPASGTKEKGKVSDTVTIFKFDDNTLTISTSNGNMQAHYGSGLVAGVLMVADVDNDTLDTDARFGILLAKGKPEKISLKGKLYSIMNLGTIDDEFEVAKVSCKQSSP